MIFQELVFLQRPRYIPSTLFQLFVFQHLEDIGHPVVNLFRSEVTILHEERNESLLGLFEKGFKIEDLMNTTFSNREFCLSTVYREVDEALYIGRKDSGRTRINPNSDRVDLVEGVLREIFQGLADGTYEHDVLPKKATPSGNQIDCSLIRKGVQLETQPANLSWSEVEGYDIITTLDRSRDSLLARFKKSFPDTRAADRAANRREQLEQEAKQAQQRQQASEEVNDVLN